MRNAAKAIGNATAALVVAPCVVGWWLSRALLGPSRALPGWSQALAILPGFLGIYLRRAFYRAVLGECGEGSVIGFGVLLTSPETRIGPRSYVGPYGVLGRVVLEEDVLLGSHVSITNGSRQHGIERLDVPIREQPGEWPLVTVGRDTWIGDRAVVMADVGEQCVIGSGSVVTKPLPARSIAVGVPARVVRRRVPGGSVPADGSRAPEDRNGGTVHAAAERGAD